MTGNYTITKGTNDLNWARFEISGGKTIDLDKSFGQNMNKSFTLPGPDGQLGNGTSHNIKVVINDNHDTYSSNEKTFYTYTEPTINTGVTISGMIPQNAISDNSFTISGTNNRTWGTDLEQDFQTRYRIKLSTSSTFTNWTNIGNITTWYRSATQMRELFPKTTDRQENILQFQRFSPSANWESTNIAEIKVMLYYRPRMAINTSTIKLYKNSSSGNSLTNGQVVTNDSSLSGIYVTWYYDEKSVFGGYTQGYRVRLYDHKNNLVKTYYTTTKYITIPKSDIPRIYDTYIDVTPYFANDTTNPDDYWYCDIEAQKVKFIRLVTDLNTPEITYPIQNSNWINHDFRICFELPTDPDYSYVEETYKYENIEVQVNGYTYRLKDSTATTSSSVKQPTIFSCLDSNLSYKRKIVIYPNLVSGMTHTSTYSIKVRVKKQYGATSGLPRWSNWSNVRTFTVAIPSYSVKQYDLILAEHFNNGFDTVDRIRNTYGVSWSNKPSRAVKKSTIIKASQYSQNNLMKKLNDTKTQVNTYATFDTGRDNIKFDYTNKLPTTFNEKVGELITADKNEGNEYNGRNYIHYLYDRFLLLK